MIRAHIEIQGIVQGVGFRPFIHKLVKTYGLRGYIKNTSSGVEMELEGPEEEINGFIADVPEKAPKLALIEEIKTEFSGELRNFEDFRILKSRTEEFRNTLISPDICICDDCLRELRDKTDRRYRYPFINCTNCGPRFTIIKDIPYDRAKTSMSDFPMCPDCDREYHDIEDRRYHAQPDCCPECGPKVFFLDGEGNELPGEAIETAREYLKAGKIIAIKGLGGMHLACRCDENIAKTLRHRKQRDEKPFALMCRDAECAKKLCHVSEEEEKILTGFRRPIVLLRKKERGLEFLSENEYLGIMLPYTPLHYLLFGDDIDMLIMTSANLSDTPIMYKNHEAVQNLRGIADGFLLHNRDIQTRCDDSLCWVRDGKEYFARRSRGYVPFPIKVDGSKSRILACGAEQKASFCLSKENYVFQSQHIGDLKNVETLENYESQIEHFKRLFDIKPVCAACDMHPDYMSSRYAAEKSEEWNIPLVKVQHHHAHMCSCMADNGLKGKVIGLIWDGTGYGTDGTVWGGECLAGDYAGFERICSIREIPLPGGDKAAKEIYRTAISLLRDSGCSFEEFENSEIIEKMLSAGFNCPKSSGMGRLFDGAAAILRIKTQTSYEGQGAVLLEAAAGEDEGLYPVEFYNSAPVRFDWRPMIRQMYKEKQEGAEISALCARFMNTLIKAGTEMCKIAREKTGINSVVLSGGSFQNMYIMERLPKALEREGFEVFCHRRVACNDEGISLGQLMAAQAVILNKKEI